MHPKKKTILVVDDSPDNLSLMNQLLKADYHVKIARSGRDALRIMNGAGLPDLFRDTNFRFLKDD